MPLNYTDDDLNLEPAANSNLAGVADVAPEHALIGLDGQPILPAAAGMRTPEQTQGLVQQQQQQAAVASSAPVRQWAATAEPAHLAATQDDLPALAGIGASVGNWLKTSVGNPITDITTAASGLAQEYVRSVKRVYDPTLSLTDRLKAEGTTVKDVAYGFGAAFAPAFAAVATPVSATLARGFAPFITQTAPLFPWEAPKPLTTPEEKLAEANRLVNTAFFGAKPNVGAGPIDAQFREVPPEAPQQLALPGPEPITPQNLRVKVAESDHAGIEEIQQRIAASATQGRSPAVMESYIAQQTRDRTVAVDPDKLLELAQQGHEPFPEHADEIVQAAKDGEPVVLPLARYLARTSGEPFAGELNAATTFRERGLSLDEAKESGARTEPEAQAATEPGTEVPAQASPEAVVPPADLDAKEADQYRNLATASDSAVDQIVQDQRLRELFSDPKAIGASKDQFDRYNLGIENAISDAKQRLTDRAYQQILAQRKPAFQEAVAQHGAEVEQELAQHPALRARAYLATGKDPLGAPIEQPFKLDREDAIAKYGKDLGLPDRYFGRDGVSADDAASEFGYDSGAEMVRDLAALHAQQGELGPAQHFKALVKQVAVARAQHELGYTLDPVAIHEAASAAINVPAIEDFLADDLKRFADEHGLPFDKQAVKQYAAQRFAQRPVREATNLRRLESFIARDVKKLETALLKGDVPAAFKWKQVLYAHQLELGQAHKFLKKYNQSERLFAKVARKVAIKTVSQDALSWSKDILASTGMAVKGNPADLARPIGGHLELSGYVGEKNNEGADILQVPVARQPLKDQTVEQYRGVSDMVRAIMTWGKKENEAILNGKTVALSEALDRGIDSLARYDRFISDEELRHPNMLQAIDAARRNVDAWLVRTEQLLRDFGDKDPNSPFFQIVTRELQTGRAYSMDKRLAIAKHFHEVAEEVGSGFDKWLKAKLPRDGIHAVVKDTSGGNLFITNRDITVAALHLGDQGALDAFTDGYNTDAETVQAIVNAHATSEMWTTVRGILDAFEQLKPDIVAKYRARTGVTPTLVSARPFQQADGTTNQGGYFPITHDPAKLPKDWIKQNEAYTNMLGSPHYQRVAPNNAYTIARTGSKVPVSMSLDSVYGRLNQTIHDLAYRDALAVSNRFLLHPRMQEAISRKYGPEYVTRLKGYLQDIAGSESVNPSDAGIARALDFLSERQQVSMIGFSPKTMIKHALTAQVQGIGEVGLARYTAAVARTRLRPGFYYDQAMAESADVRHILSTYNEDAYRQFLRTSTGRYSITRAGLSTAFHLIGMSNRLVAVPLYDAAKQMIAEQHPELDEGSLRDAAGQIVRQALGSAGPTESPRAIRPGSGLGGRLVRLTNPFMSFDNHMYNKLREVPQNLGYAGQKVNFARAISVLMTAGVLSIFINQAVSKGVKAATHFLSFWGEGLVHQLAAQVPFLNSSVAAAVAKMDKASPGGDNVLTESGGDVGQGALDLYNRVAHQRPLTQAKIHNLIMAGGFVSPVPYPSLEAVRLEEFFHKIGEGKESDWQTVLHDLTLGPAPGTTR